MHFIIKFVLFIFVVLCAYLINSLSHTPELPQLKEIWWGSRDPKLEDLEIRPFKINVSDKVLEDLAHRLKISRPMVSSFPDVQHTYGINDKLLNEIITFWKDKYNWRQREKYLNKYPQYTVSIQGLKLHYVHVKPKNVLGKRILPLLILHGWPCSPVEFYELIPLLTNPRESHDYVFEVIAPSLPGYGFSENAVLHGLGPAQMAVVFKNFMVRLGYKKYFVQGGDWGAAIAHAMATIFPEKVIGLHSNMCLLSTGLAQLKTMLGSLYPSLIVSKEHQHKMYPLTKYYQFLIEEMGYLHLQATKPDTLGVALNDSPTGLASYILEKFIVFTNRTFKLTPSGGLKEKYSYEPLIDNIMIYWITNSITTSMRLYAEAFSKAQLSLNLNKIPTKVPTVCARFSDDVVYQPDAILRDKFVNLVYSSDYDGGHFPAMEQPAVLANDIFVGIQKIEDFRKNEAKKL